MDEHARYKVTADSEHKAIETALDHAHTRLGLSELKDNGDGTWDINVFIVPTTIDTVIPLFQRDMKFKGTK